MTEPAKKRATYVEQRKESVEEILAAARPLPPLEEMMIEDLTEEEARAFYRRSITCEPARSRTGGD